MVRKLLKNIKIYLILSFGFLLLSNANSQISVSGKVISASDNAPLPGASVVIAGKAKGTITNLDGEFKLTV
jgi:TonB-dependent starch-binding outer membrane protein SusC